MIADWHLGRALLRWRPMRVWAASALVALLLAFAVGCSSADPDAGPGEIQVGAFLPSADAGEHASDAANDARADAAHVVDAADAGNGCFESKVGVFGQCMTLAACAALGPYTSTPGYCAGGSGIECCAKTPSVADNPPFPAGWSLMMQSEVTSDMTSWAVAILHDPTTYPMFSTTMRVFGSLLVMARVEWHPPDFQNQTVHRGVTLFEPTD